MLESREILVCTGCGEPGDPADSICPLCGYHHLGRLKKQVVDEPPAEAQAGSQEADVAQVDPETDPDGPPGDQKETQGDGPATVLFTYVCQNPTCQRVNRIYNQEHNRCFNCGRELWLGKEAREARWYEEHGRRVLGKQGRELREKGEEMNRAAGRPPLARSTRHFGGLSGGEYWVKVGPDPEDQPDDYEPPEAMGCRGCLFSLAVIVVGFVALISLLNLIW